MNAEATPDFESIKTRQQATWATGNFAVTAIQIQFASDVLAETVDIRAGSRVLDVACGSGNATIAAARRGAEVSGIDYVPALLEQARIRTAAEGLEATYIEADAENLPFPDASFDTVLSVFGAMFAPNQERAASELARVTTPGGNIALATWIPDGFTGEMFRLLGSYVPPPTGLRPPLEWSSEERLRELFCQTAFEFETTPQVVTFRALSAEQFVEANKTYFGPLAKAFELLDDEKGAELHDKLVDLATKYDRLERDDAIAVPAAYVETVITRT